MNAGLAAICCLAMSFSLALMVEGIHNDSDIVGLVVFLAGAGLFVASFVGIHTAVYWDDREED